MRYWFASSLFLVSLLVSSAVAVIPRLPLPEPLAAEGHNATKEAVFHQLIDHNNPGLGTFEQRYWYNAEWWKGPGAPVGY